MWKPFPSKRLANVKRSPKGKVQRGLYPVRVKLGRNTSYPVRVGLGRYTSPEASLANVMGHQVGEPDIERVWKPFPRKRDGKSERKKPKKTVASIGLPYFLWLIFGVGSSICRVEDD